MLEPPFDIISCSWPRPVEQAGDQWISEPEWDAPLMPMLLQPYWVDMSGDICWTIDWCRLFSGGLKYWEQSRVSGPYWHSHPVEEIYRLLGPDLAFYRPVIANAKHST